MKRFNQHTLIFSSIIIGFLLAFMFMSSFNTKEEFEDLALGKATVPHFATDSNNINVHYLPKVNANNFLNDLSFYLQNQTILYLGNSQSHSINQKQKNDNTMSGYLFTELIKDSISFLTASIPNANLQEHYLLYNFFSNKIPNLKLVILPVFMDDLRETGIREAYFSSFSKTEHLITDTNQIAQEINSMLTKFKKPNSTTKSNIDNKALNETTQEIVEKKLNDVLESNFKFWGNRKNIRGNYFNLLYKSRNSLFNISSQSTRKMIKNRYEKNFKALNLIIKSALNKNIKILLVIPPIRKDIKNPYDISEYENFKTDINNLCKKYNINYLDFDNIIDGKYWGYSAPTQLFKDKDYDFMHFQAKAHRILADSLKPYILKEINHAL